LDEKSILASTAVGFYSQRTVEHLRKSTIVAMQGAISAMKSLHDQLNETEGAYYRWIESMEKDTPIEESLEAIAAGATRIKLNERLEELEHLRHAARLAMIAVALDEGMSIGQVGRILGFSRQLAARYAKEVRSMADSGSVAGGVPNAPIGSGRES
jgi:hypothetical protein